MMRGKTVVVTGANSGIGRATAAELLKLQARVIMACRDPRRAEEAAERIRQEAGAPPGQAVVKVLDLGSLRSVRRFCEQIIE
ncbi:retinol dehydrogenase 14-like, partial [Arapaima gigas]